MITFAGCAEKTTSASSAGIEQTSIVFYYGEGCPHCKLVEDYLKKNNVSQKLTYQTKEVYSNEANNAEMSEKATKCGIKPEGMGVPFLWDGNNCLVGDPKIIEFFKKKI